MRVVAQIGETESLYQSPNSFRKNQFDFDGWLPMQDPYGIAETSEKLWIYITVVYMSQFIARRFGAETVVHRFSVVNFYLILFPVVLAA